MADFCDDNRFELIEKYKQKLIDETNIESAPDEMKVLDNIMFRIWQMGWLDKLEQTAQQWIPFKTRPLTEEEKEEHPEWDFILDCPLPDDGQRILVNIQYKGHEAVQLDEYYDDDGSYLDSGYEIGTEANAWKPLPEPWKGEQE